MLKTGHAQIAVDQHIAPHHGDPAGGGQIGSERHGHAAVAAARRVGLDVLVLDLTRPDIGLNVVKVVVPGMRFFWQRFAQGRLYDVPVKMGWLNEPTPEARLNRTPMPF